MEAPGSSPLDREIETVRGFNRFYTRVLGALNEGIHASALPLPQARVLYELAQGTATTAGMLARETAMDAGHLSRTVAALEAAGLVSRTPSREDARSMSLALTEEGRAMFDRLQAAASDEVRHLLRPLTEGERRDLVAAMSRVRRLLGDGASQPADAIIRDPRPGDLGRVVAGQGRLYAEEYGLDWTFEALVAEIVAGFARNFDPTGERCWIAELDGTAVGSIFLVRQSAEVAKLRLLYVERNARGLGLGQRLVEACIGFARQSGYRTVTLWTNDILVSARRIYVAAGFRLVGEERHHSFGRDLVGQNWELDLGPQETGAR
ncbi:GNAT family N-acetyltransferase [Jiella sp. M17.18]|uniref:bifunctional helix-turn-helix transcriptional regulator/GNAT family N-acetyltransferase n=1 Tax=Jiella sp. M17.18 TaxID=3234247 RepID=UPI0034DF6A73